MAVVMVAALYELKRDWPFQKTSFSHGGFHFGKSWQASRPARMKRAGSSDPNPAAQAVRLGDSRINNRKGEPENLPSSMCLDGKIRQRGGSHW
jgi:hypothetical protein